MPWATSRRRKADGTRARYYYDGQRRPKKIRGNLKEVTTQPEKYPDPEKEKRRELLDLMITEKDYPPRETPKTEKQLLQIILEELRGEPEDRHVAETVKYLKKLEEVNPIARLEGLVWLKKHEPLALKAYRLLEDE